MDSVKAYEELKEKAEAARLKAVEELENKKTALLGQMAEIDAQLASLGLHQASDSGRTASKKAGTGKGAMTEEKRQKLSAAATARWNAKKAQTN